MQQPFDTYLRGLTSENRQAESPRATQAQAAHEHRTCTDEEKAANLKYQVATFNDPKQVAVLERPQPQSVMTVIPAQSFMQVFIFNSNQ